MTTYPPVFGKTVDDHTRGERYLTELDIIAIRFCCCDRYYPGHLCHAECAEHLARQRPREKWKLPAILGGACQTELTIEAYLGVDECPECAAAFNLGCKAHSSYYFAVGESL